VLFDFNTRFNTDKQYEVEIKKSDSNYIGLFCWNSTTIASETAQSSYNVGLPHHDICCNEICVKFHVFSLK